MLNYYYAFYSKGNSAPSKQTDKRRPKKSLAVPLRRLIEAAPEKAGEIVQGNRLTALNIVHA